MNLIVLTFERKIVIMFILGNSFLRLYNFCMQYRAILILSVILKHCKQRFGVQYACQSTTDLL